MVPETCDKNWSRYQAGRTGLASAKSRVSLGAALAENAGLPRECARESDARSQENPARPDWPDLPHGAGLGLHCFAGYPQLNTACAGSIFSFPDRPTQRREDKTYHCI
jgi:hypothetical protein